MGKKRKLYIFWGWTFILFGLAKGQDITFENPSNGFFIKKLYNKNGVQDPNSISEMFILNEPSDGYKLQIKNGPFESHQTIPKGLIEAIHSKNRRNSSLMHRSVVFDMDVSAHIVSSDISQKLPRLQVLVHAVPHVKAKLGTSQNGQWCAQIFIEAKGVELTSVCILREKEQVCVTGIDLPKDWWSQNGTAASVSYSFVSIDQNNQCASASNAIIPGKVLSNNNDSGVFKQTITTLHLVLNEESYEEWKDQDILIDVPREVFHHGDSFEIPIRLEANSDLQVFVMRARVRQGLRITGARMTDPSSQWSIHVDIKDNQKTGTVTAFVRDAKIYMKSKSVQDVFRWQMEVAEDMYDTNTGRIVWSIEYTRDGIERESYLSQDSKIVSQINIHNKDLQRLVPVLKVNEILNLAILSGREQIYPLRIYAVDDSEKFKDVTQQTRCHSVEVDVLKVGADCSSVYVDGAESRGSHNVTIIAKSGHVTAFMDITVWIPEDRLDIQLSDDRLSRIKNWRVPGSKKRRRRSLNSYMALLDPKSSKQRSCELQRQQATVEVYTRFYIQTPKSTDYFMGRNAFLKVTDLVQSRLRMSDTRIATLNGKMIKGREDGRTEIQILSPRNGYVLAAKEIRVGHDKVSVKRLNLKLITDLQLYVRASNQIEGALVATAVERDQLLSQFQEGVIDVVLEFSDMTRMPLRLIFPEDYFLEVTQVDSKVVGIVEGKLPYQAQLVALREGSGNLIKITLKISESCRKRKSKPIAASELFVNVNFSQERPAFSDVPFQNDAYYYSSNKASDRWDLNEQKKPEFTLKVNEYENKDFPETKFSHGKFNKQDNVHMIAIKDDIGEIASTEEGTRQEPLKAKQDKGLSDLEIGMYVLVAVFCVAISVFMINCVVFFVRYKRKQKPAKASPDAISSANDWVWIGRATLERNSVYTRSSRTLMPEEDFNGNHTRPVSSSSESSRGGSTPSSAPNSNRNSTVSTYKGSECSIRITTNPLNEEGAVADPVPEETQSDGPSEKGPQWDYEAMGMNYNQLLEYFDNLKESTA